MKSVLRSLHIWDLEILMFSMILAYNVLLRGYSHVLEDVPYICSPDIQQMGLRRSKITLSLSLKYIDGIEM